MTIRIPFNKLGLTGNELNYVTTSVNSGKIVGNGEFAQKCTELLEKTFSAKKVLLTPSCTSALEMATLLCGLGEGDEVILPSYTFVSTANALALQGVQLKFIDIRHDTKNIDETLIEAAITDKTKAIVPVHYAGVACDMDSINRIASDHDLFVIEDAAQGVNATYKGAYLGTLGDIGAYSFHETKNYVCGEGGAILVNNEDLLESAEIIQEKGTNRQRFLRGQVDKYTWVEIGSSYLLADVLAAFLYAQLEQLDAIAARRQKIYNSYLKNLAPLSDDGLLELPFIPNDCRSNFHMFYVLAGDENTRNNLITHLKSDGILAVFHYVPLHSSPMGKKLGCSEQSLPVTNDVSGRLVRLPFYNDISQEEISYVTKSISRFFMG